MLFESGALPKPPNLHENKIWFVRKFVSLYINMLERVFLCTCNRKWVVHGNGYVRHAIRRCASVSSTFDVHNNLIRNLFFSFDAISEPIYPNNSNTITADVCLAVSEIIFKKYIYSFSTVFNSSDGIDLLKCAIHCFTLWNGNCICILHKSVD